MRNSHLDDELECIIEQLRAKNVELKAMVNELRDVVLHTMCDIIESDFTEEDVGVMETLRSLRKAHAKTPAQALHDHCAKCTKTLPNREYDMALAEKVREACLEAISTKFSVTGTTNAICNLDLTAIVRGNGERE